MPILVSRVGKVERFLCLHSLHSHRTLSERRRYCARHVTLLVARSPFVRLDGEGAGPSESDETANGSSAAKTPLHVP